MSEPRNVRRFGRHDRKEELPPVPPLFPPEDMSAPEEPDFMALVPDTDHEALTTLAQLPPDAVRPLKITPPEQRFPPLQPASLETSKPTTQHLSQAAHPTKTLPKRRNVLLYNVITFFMCMSTLVLLGVYGIIWNEPQSVLNPFPPDVLFIYVTATPGSLPQSVPTSANLTGAELPPTDVSAAGSVYPFIMTDVGVLYTANANGRECEWASIAGTVTTKDGTALNGYRVRVTGDGFDETVFTGAALTFGAGGFEMPLGNVPQNATYDIQLFSPQGAPLSEIYPLTTRAECDSNVAIINFVQNGDL